MVAARSGRRSLLDVISMGRGDPRTKRGKRFRGSYGVARPKPRVMRERKRAAYAEREAKGTPLQPEITGPYFSASTIETLNAFKWPEPSKWNQELEEIRLAHKQWWEERQVQDKKPDEEEEPQDTPAE